MLCVHRAVLFFFFFNDTATTEIYTLSLHDALPIYRPRLALRAGVADQDAVACRRQGRAPLLGRARLPAARDHRGRSEEHTSELQSLAYLVCRLLLEKKKKKQVTAPIHLILYSHNK